MSGVTGTSGSEIDCGKSKVRLSVVYLHIKHLQILIRRFLRLEYNI
jgi:hypothetical protein